MPLIQPVTYEPKITEIKGESQLAALILDVRACVSELDCNFEDKNYLKVLAVIEQGHHDATAGRFCVDRINLQDAKDLIKTYRLGSEGGCLSCTHLALFKLRPDDGVYYCKFDESEEDARNHWVVKSNSVYGTKTDKVRKFWEQGCDARDKKFMRTVEEVLTDVQKNGLSAVRS
jgi:hypothetical protein